MSYISLYGVDENAVNKHRNCNYFKVLSAEGVAPLHAITK